MSWGLAGVELEVACAFFEAMGTSSSSRKNKSSNEAPAASSVEVLDDELVVAEGPITHRRSISEMFERDLSDQHLLHISLRPQSIAILLVIFE